MGIFFFFPETRYNRSIDAAATATAPVIEATDKSMTEHRIEHVHTTDSHILIGTKKTFLQELNIWSGTTKQSYFNHFIRPFPLLAYPAVAWGVLTCK